MARPDADWYFAYGSNLDPDTFCRRRRIQPQASCCGVLHDFSLNFNLPVGSSNRGVANVSSRDGSKVWGVAYKITAAQAKGLDRSEGVHRDFYRRITVTIDVGELQHLHAFTYTSQRGRDGRLPSARYLGLLITGARHHQLPAAWIDWLNAWPLAIDERTDHQSDLFRD